MKKILLSVFFILILSVSIRAEYSDTITETVYSATDTITINKVINITIANYESYTIDTTPNIIIIFDNYLINSDSYSVIVNGDTQIDRTLIDTDIITVEIELLENTNNQITVLTDFGSETINIIPATQTAYSIADTIIINASTPSFIFDLINYVSDYSRFKKIWELYPQLSGVSGFKFWHELATLENDNYYREPNLPYLKFKRLAAKYK